jgi:hypothetical protein
VGRGFLLFGILRYFTVWFSEVRRGWVGICGRELGMARQGLSWFGLEGRSGAK